jgi:hypothetical protein
VVEAAAPVRPSASLFQQISNTVIPNEERNLFVEQADPSLLSG